MYQPICFGFIRGEGEADSPGPLWLSSALTLLVGLIQVDANSAKITLEVSLAPSHSLSWLLPGASIPIATVSTTGPAALQTGQTCAQENDF